MENQDLLNAQLVIDDVASQQLLETAKWGRFLSIVGFVFCGIFVLIGFGASALFSTFGSLYGNATGGFSVLLGIVYALISLLYFFPCLFLFRFSAKMKAAIPTYNQEQFNEALYYHRRLYKFVGILTIIGLVFYALALLIGLAGLAVGR